MMKIAVLLAVLSVSIHQTQPFALYGSDSGQQARALRRQRPHNQNTLDNSSQQQAQVNQPRTQNDPAAGAGDTSDTEVAATEGPGAAPQEATPMASASPSPGAGGEDSSDSSSSEEVSEAPGATNAPDAGDGAATTAPPAEPIEGTVTTNSEMTSAQLNVTAIPIPLKLKPQEQTATKEAKKSNLAIALTTVGVVTGVAATSIVAYKNKDAITARMGL